MEPFTITKIRGDSRQIEQDLVAQEVPFTLHLSGNELVTLLCSPSELEDLARGFLFTSGMVRELGQIKGLTVDTQRWVCYVELNDKNAQDLLFKRLYTSGCGRGVLFYNAIDIMYRSKLACGFKIGSLATGKLMLDFQKSSEIYTKTGGVHSAALADEKNILIFREDIGRHNAIDKVIGCALKEKITLEDKVLITSGRMSSEVVFKIRKCAIPVAVSRGAPTDQAVRLGREMNITLVGFARGNRLNVYSAEERIV